jgi:MFS family permease
MGLQSTFVNGGGMIMVILSGLLAKIAWPDAYLLFLLFIPAFIGLAGLLPPGKVMAQSSGSKLGINRSIAYLSGIALIFSLLYTTYSTNVALYLDATRLGDATSAGLATSLLTGAGIAAGLVFGRIFRVFRGFTLPLTLGLVTVGLLLTYFGGSLLMVFAGGLISGFGFSILMPLGIFLAVQSAAPELSAFAIAVFTGSVGIGSFISPVLIDGLATLAGHSDVKTRFLVASIGVLILLVITLARELRIRPRLAQITEDQ